MNTISRPWLRIAAGVTLIGLPGLLAAGSPWKPTAPRPKHLKPETLETLVSTGLSSMQTQTPNTTGSRPIQHVDTASFRQAVLDADIPVLVDFYADWCGPCRQLAPVLADLARETPTARIVKVDIDRSPELARQYGVSSIPTLILFHNGQPASKIVGAAPKSTLRQMLAAPAGGPSR